LKTVEVAINQSRGRCFEVNLWRAAGLSKGILVKYQLVIPVKFAKDYINP
jgi:hypothetical protein